jgi:23S rRNA (guanine745-N1)-methyltransferase
MLICPVCGKALQFIDRTAKCDHGHSFDIAKEGYVNLLRGSKSGDKIGDDKFSARCRRDFLNQGYYAPLKDALWERFADQKGTLLDICCGEGYYTGALADNKNLDVYGFDIAREMIRLAAKRGKGTYFVANMAAIPVSDASFDYAIHLFAPFLEKEFYRVLKSGGSLYTVIPGENHLFGLKQAIYDTPYRNDEKLPETNLLQLADVQKIVSEITLKTPQDIESVFRMTPYYFHTSLADREKLKAYETLQTPIEFVIAHYVKTEG